MSNSVQQFVKLKRGGGKGDERLLITVHLVEGCLGVGSVSHIHRVFPPGSRFGNAPVLRVFTQHVLHFLLVLVD